VIRLKKDSITMAVRDEHQLAAFLNNGWVRCDEKEEKSDFSQYMNPPEEPTGTNYTKTDINRMSKAELLERAKATGVEGAEDMTGTELKEYLIALFGL
jgi:hypothetical protein